jgi:tetrahydromethanopterin S-methyltransferase subunit F
MKKSDSLEGGSSKNRSQSGTLTRESTSGSKTSDSTVNNNAQNSPHTEYFSSIKVQEQFLARAETLQAGSNTNLMIASDTSKGSTSPVRFGPPRKIDYPEEPL